MDRGEIIALDTPQNLIRALNTDSAIECHIPDMPTIPTWMNQLHEAKKIEHRKDTFVIYTDQLQHTLLDFVKVTSAERIVFTDLQTRTATLEDVFIHMTGRSLRE